MASGPPHAQQRQHNFNNQSAFLPNGSTVGGPTPGAVNLLPNQGRIITNGPTRILCIADVRGNLRSLNELAKQARADHILHTGDFGFYDDTSLERIADKTLKHVAQYSPLLKEHTKKEIALAQPNQPVKQRFQAENLPLSELPLFLNKTYTLDVPVYTVWGACEDVRVLEKFRSGEYKIDKLHIIDEANSRLLEVAGVKLRLLGLGGAVVMHKLFDNGEGRTTIAGGQGTMWTTLLQMGELIDTANRVYDPAETRIFITHASPAREGILNQISVMLKADFSISAGLHFRYGSSYNEFSVNPSLDHYRGKLAASKASFNDVWETVKAEVEPAVAQNDSQQVLLKNALDIVSRMPSNANGGNPFGGPANNAGAGQVDESAFKNMWNFNLADAAFGYLVLEIDTGRIGTEMRAQGFNFSHRSNTKAAAHPAQSAPVPTQQQSQQGTPQQATNEKGSMDVKSSAPTGPGQNRGGQSGSQYGHDQSAPYQRGQSYQGSQQTGTPTGPSRAVASPVPVVPSSTQPKPATPQPVANTVNLPETQESSKPAVSSIQTENIRNGTPAAPGDAATPSRAKNQSPVDARADRGLFVSGVPTSDKCREIFPDEDKSNIEDIQARRAKSGHNYYYVFFKTVEAMNAALERQPEGNKKQGGGRDQPYVKRLDDDWHGGQGGQRRGGGGWGPGRGGQAGMGGGQGAYKNSSASEGEGGGFRGGRGAYRTPSRGGRGQGERGDRGGRGGRGGKRGGFKDGDASAGTSSPAPAASTPTPAAGSS